MRNRALAVLISIDGIKSILKILFGKKLYSHISDL